ncbi:cyclase family protein [Aurantibacter sp.]|uniref:cyclase family protein n=1 Tax=Aurantibacter sp. TaxID=2807103 RepID=UPI0035C7EC55
MIAEIQLKNKKIKVDFSKPLDLSISIKSSVTNVNAWYIDEPKINPVQLGDWTGSVEKGADVNFNNIAFNPHAHGTHTECVGHISKAFRSINKALKTFMFLAEVITVAPESLGDDLVISKHQIEHLLKGKNPEALVIRTMPNTKDKKNKQYSNTNWPYLTEEAALFIREKGIQHLLIDLPSVDKEKDDGKLLAHKAFWNYPENTRKNATITEFIYVPNKVIDGSYLLNLQIAPFKNDASPSKPILYKLL